MIASALPAACDSSDLESTFTPLTALVVSHDKALHRRLNHYLQEAGYLAIHTHSAEHALALLETTGCQFLIVDGELPTADPLELCREAGASPRGALVAKILLQSDQASSDFANLLHAGIDDCLLKPPSYLELLARLRAAARTVEFRRRLELSLGLDALTQLPAAHVGHRRLEVLVQQNEESPLSCLMLGLDHFDQHLTSAGTVAMDSLLATLAQLISREVLENEQASYWGEACFCITCAGQNLRNTADRAEELSRALSTALASHATAIPISLSMGVAERTAQDTAQSLMDSALDALQVAQHSGGHSVSCFGEHAAELAELSQLGGTNHVFHSTLAAHLMTPCVLTFSESHGVWQAANLLRRHRLPAAAVIDASGKSLGLLEESQLPTTQLEAGNQSVSNFCCPEAQICNEDTPLGSIMQIFSNGDTSWLLVTRHGRPTGTIARDSLAALSHPLSVETLRAGASRQPVGRLNELLVPEAVMSEA